MKVKSVALVLAVCLLAAAAARAEAPKPADALAVPPGPSLESDEGKTLYALGVWLANRVQAFGLSESELAVVQQGLADGVTGRPQKVDVKTYGPKIDTLLQSRVGVAASAAKKAGQEFADKAAAEAGAVRKPSGLIYKELKAGTGDAPAATDRVKVHYHGTLIDGTVFDSSVQRGEPAEFALSQVIKCWTEGLQLMKVGGKSRLVCPSDIAYGDRGAGAQIKPGATLVFEVELLGIVK